MGGLERVYEIGRCYRNEGISTRHNPEFTMLEFYQAYATYEELMDFTEVLLRGVDERLARGDARRARRSGRRRARSRSTQPFVRVPMDRAVAAAAERTAIPEWLAAVGDRGGAGLVDAAAAGLRGAHQGVGEVVAARQGPRLEQPPQGPGQVRQRRRAPLRLLRVPGRAVPGDDYRTDDGKRSVPVFVKDYPFEVSPLARRNDRDPKLTDRFELFVHGRELCNAFSELNDPDDQAARFRAQVERRRAATRRRWTSTRTTSGPSSTGCLRRPGFGMGIDRLVMALTNAASIRDVILFPLLRPEAGGPRA